MHIKLKPLRLIALAVAMYACSEDGRRSDAYGNFEAEEVLVSAEANGRLLAFEVEEGLRLNAGDTVGWVDTTTLHLKKKQLRAQIEATLSRLQDVDVQLEVYREKKRNLLREQKRLKNLLADGAATQKQLDDLEGEIEVVEKQLEAQARLLADQNRTFRSQIQPLLVQIEQAEDAIRRCRIENPIDGVVLTTYAEPTEMTGAGKQLYKIANTSELELRVYVSGSQLPRVKLGQEVEVLIDRNAEEYARLPGRVSWIAEEAEFTPKIIQTKEERVDLVYAVKVRVPNDGTLKIGMPGEVNFPGGDRSPVNASEQQGDR